PALWMVRARRLSAAARDPARRALGRVGSGPRRGVGAQQRLRAAARRRRELHARWKRDAPRRQRRAPDFSQHLDGAQRDLRALRLRGTVVAPAGFFAEANGGLGLDLRINGLSKTYGSRRRALAGVSLAIPRGMFGLLGPNGAGKSTLMRIVATLQQPDAGTVQLGDVDVLRQPDAVRKTLGYLPQEFGLYPNVAAESLLSHFAVLKGITDRAERDRIVGALLEQTNLADARRQKLGGFSGGMRQRFGIAVALLGKPKLIIVDEPTAGLDPAERVRFLNLLAELGEEAVVILSTHIVDDVSDLCSRMAIIDRGEIRLEAEPATAIAAMQARIWQRSIERSELAEFQRTHTVVSTKLSGGKTVVRVVADAPPSSEFEPARATLEDVYFAALRRA